MPNRIRAQDTRFMKLKRFTGAKSRPKTYGLLLVSMLVLLILGGLMVGTRRAREPAYGGRPLSAWLEDLIASSLRKSASKQAAHAVQQMGTNVLPVLMAILSAEESPLAKMIARLPPKLPFWPRASPDEWPAPTKLEQRKVQAAYAVGALGASAETAVPELAKQLSWPGVALAPFLALGRIGEPGIGPLSNALTSPDLMVRVMAIYRFAMNMCQLHHSPEDD